MTRLTLLILILGLGLGLYVWSNPPARERAEAAWQETRTYFVELYARVSPSITDVFSGGGAQASAENNVSASAEDETGASDGSLGLGAFFESMRDVFLSFAARLRLELS